MYNSILKQLRVSINKSYKTGIVTAVLFNNIYQVTISNGLQLTIQDTKTTYVVNDSVFLALVDGELSKAVILKKTSGVPTIKASFIIGNATD